MTMTCFFIEFFNVISSLLNDRFFSHVSPLGPIQRYRIVLASFDWNYFDQDRLVLLSGKEYFDYVIPSRSNIVFLFSRLSSLFCQLI